MSARGWSEHPEFTDFLFNSARVVAAAKGAKGFLAYLDGQPIANAVLWSHEGVALFGGACTVPEARKQGAQRALFETRTNAALDQGCDLAVLCAQPGSTSQRNAERQGFRIAYTRVKWQRWAT